MEKRDPCIDFLKGICELKEKCKYAHMIIPNKEEYIKINENLKKNVKPIFANQEEYKPHFTDFNGKAGKKCLTKCQDCGKGFIFEQEKIAKGDPESITCPACLNGENIFAHNRR